MNSVLSVGMPSRMTSLEKFVEASLVQRSSLRDDLGTCARTVMAAHGSEKLESTSGSWGMRECGRHPMLFWRARPRADGLLTCSREPRKAQKVC